MASHVEVTMFPWLLPGELVIDAEQYTRRSVVVSHEFQEASTDVCEDRLPKTGCWSDSQGVVWRRFELPCADWSADSQAREAEITVSNSGPAIHRIKAALAGALPRPSRLGRDEDGGVSNGAPSFPPAHLERGRLVEEITDNHVEFINDLWDAVRPHRHYGEENVQGSALRPMRRALARWRRADRRDEARLALIVKLAAKLPVILQDVCLRPRVVLRRVRKMIGVSRVQETDPGCLRWLARQPGRTVVEKAGMRQQVLGIVRVEDADTPENRVMKDLLLRALIECRRYLSENRQFPNHDRVVTVRRFRTLIDAMLRDSPVGNVASLVGEAQPNYVLQHESRYSVLWEAYLLLVRQQKLQEDIWRWRERTWSEVCQLAVWDTMRTMGATGSAWRSDVMCRDQQNAGKFFDDEFAVAGWDPLAPIGNIAAEVAVGSQISQHPLISPDVRRLSPDIAIVPASTRAAPILLIWTLLQVPMKAPGFLRAVERLGNRVSELQRNLPAIGLILTPRSGDCQQDEPTMAHGIEVVRLSVPVQGASDRLARVLQRCWVSL
jgi:Domain of unknown function (DUF2357).